MKNKKFAVVMMIILAASGLPGPGIARSQTVSEQPATPEAFNETGAKLLISEVNLKNKEHDFVEIYYESPTGKPLNIKNFQFQDDTAFKKIGQDFWLYSKEYYLLQFKTEGPDSQASKLLTTTRTGLTATTEQVLFKDPAGKILDALCWSSAAPTADETGDMQELFENEGWISAAPSTCFPSAGVSTNQSLVRINLKDTDSVSDWTVTDDVSPGKSNDVIPITDENSGPAAASSQVPADSIPAASPSLPAESIEENTEATTGDENDPDSGDKTPTVTQKNTTTSKTTAAKTTSTAKKNSTVTKTAAKKSTSKSATPRYKNGDSSTDIVISEVYPRATEDDRNNEWIELTNTGETDVNMGNWQVDDGEGGSKPYVLPDTMTIPAGGAVVIRASESKLSLANAKDTVRLFDPAGKLSRTVEYEEAPKDESYARILIRREDGETEEQWLWEKESTPGEPNPEYAELSGTITANAEFGATYFFKFRKTPSKEDPTRQREDGDVGAGESGGGLEFTVVFDETLIAGPMAKAAFRQGASVKITGMLDPESPGVFLLKQYEMTGNGPAEQAESSSWFWVGLLPPGGAGFWYGLKKLRKLYGKI